MWVAPVCNVQRPAWPSHTVVALEHHLLVFLRRVQQQWPSRTIVALEQRLRVLLRRVEELRLELLPVASRAGELVAKCAEEGVSVAGRKRCLKKMLCVPACLRACVLCLRALLHIW